MNRIFTELIEVDRHWYWFTLILMFCNTVLVHGELHLKKIITSTVSLIQLFLERMRNWNAFLPKS